MTFEITFAALLRMWTCTDDPQISLVKSFLSQNILRASDSNSHGSVKKASVMTSASQRDRHLSVFLKMTKKSILRSLCFAVKKIGKLSVN